MENPFHLSVAVVTGLLRPNISYLLEYRFTLYNGHPTQISLFILFWSQLWAVFPHLQSLQNVRLIEINIHTQKPSYFGARWKGWKFFYFSIIQLCSLCMPAKTSTGGSFVKNVDHFNKKVDFLNKIVDLFHLCNKIVDFLNKTVVLNKIVAKLWAFYFRRLGGFSASTKPPWLWACCGKNCMSKIVNPISLWRHSISRDHC